MYFGSTLEIATFLDVIDRRPASFAATTVRTIYFTIAEKEDKMWAVLERCSGVRKLVLNTSLVFDRISHLQLTHLSLNAPEVLLSWQSVSKGAHPSFSQVTRLELYFYFTTLGHSQLKGLPRLSHLAIHVEGVDSFVDLRSEISEFVGECQSLTHFLLLPDSALREEFDAVLDAIDFPGTTIVGNCPTINKDWWSHLGGRDVWEQCARGGVVRAPRSSPSEQKS